MGISRDSSDSLIIQCNATQPTGFSHRKLSASFAGVPCATFTCLAIDSMTIQTKAAVSRGEYECLRLEAIGRGCEGESSAGLYTSSDVVISTDIKCTEIVLQAIGSSLHYNRLSE